MVEMRKSDGDLRTSMKHHRILIRFFSLHFFFLFLRNSEIFVSWLWRMVCSILSMWYYSIIFLNVLCAYYYTPRSLFLSLSLCHISCKAHKKKNLNGMLGEISSLELIENSLSKMKMSVRERYTLWFVFFPFLLSRSHSSSFLLLLLLPRFMIKSACVCGIKALSTITIHELHEWYMCLYQCHGSFNALKKEIFSSRCWQ